MIAGCKATVAERLLASALDLGSQGFRVFPLEVDGSKPAFAGWQDKAASNPEAVAAMWRSATGEPIPYNIGVRTGDGLTVLDVDIKKGRDGAESLDDLVTFQGLTDDTFTVRTKSGGFHLYYQSHGLNLRNSVGQLAPGLDVRSDGGYVVGPGSTVGELSYEVVKPLAIAPIQPWFAALCGQARAKGETALPLVELDTPDAIARATDWLRNEAPEVTADSGNGDITAYKVACHVKDFGLSEHQCLVLILEVFDEAKSHPPQGQEVWERKVENAYRHGLSAPGVKNPMADFEVEELSELSVHTSDWPQATPLVPFNALTLPPRQWVIGRTFARTFASAIIAPGGTGKTQWILQAALAVASGRAGLIGRPVTERTPVWYWNQEDDLNELRRRIAAAMQHFGLTWDDLTLGGKPMLYIDSGVERPLTLAVRGNNEDEAKPTLSVAKLKQAIKDRGIGLFIADPLIEFHKVKENSNEQMRQVWEILRNIAVECNCATAVGAHTRKPDGASSDGHAGDINSLRGAGSQAGAMRTGITMLGMSTTDAKALGVTESDRHLFVKLDDAKANLFLKAPGADWYKRTNVLVGGLGGQDVGVLDPVKLAVTAGHDLVDVLAKALSGLPVSQWHAANHVIERVAEEQRKMFGGSANRARTLKDLFAGADEVMTDFGKVQIFVQAKTPAKLRLEPASSLHQGHDEEAKALISLASSPASSADEGAFDEGS